MDKSLKEYCIQNNRTDLLEQWHPVKNGELQPSQVMPGSHKRIWWKCAKGHEWEVTVKSRTKGTGCPVCTNRVVISGVNDLATVHPTLAAQWHPTKNSSFTPDKISYGLKKHVWWQCEHGHEWQATINSRSRGSGCPVCAGRVVIPGVNDFASLYPQLAAQWLQERNEPLRPDQVTPYSNKKVWWRCSLGHEGCAIISSRYKNGCPYCSGRRVLKGFNDLQTKEPLIAAEWHPTLNGELNPDMVTPGSHKRVWWKCPVGHVWKTVVYSRGSLKTGCPYCYGRPPKDTFVPTQSTEQDN